MKGRYVLGSLLGGMGLFLGGMIFWTMLPLSFSAMQPLPKEKAILGVLRANIPQSGVYLYPMPTEGKDALKTHIAKHKAGPLVMMFYRKEGMNPMEPQVFVMGFFQHLLSALLAGLLMLLTLQQLQSFERRYFFIVLLGVFASVWVDLSAPIWFHQPWNYHLFNAISRIGSWMIAAIPMAWLIKESS